jgi:hypothetical protein
VARAFLRNGLLASAGEKLPTIAANMRAARRRFDMCPGVQYFSEEEWSELAIISPEPVVGSVSPTR